MADLHGAVMVVSALHQRYKLISDPNDGLIPLLISDFDRPEEEGEEGLFDEAAWNNKRRSSLRFLTELFIVGVLPSLDPVVAILTRMMKEDDTKRDFANLSLVREFAKVAGLDILGIKARDQAVELAPLASAMEEGDKPVISDEKRDELSNLLKAYHTRVGTRLCNVHKRLKAQEKKNYETEMMKGELSAQRQAEFKELNDEHAKLMSNLKTLSDVLVLEMPELLEEEEEVVAVGSSISMAGRQVRPSHTR